MASGLDHLNTRHLENIADSARSIELSLAQLVDMLGEVNHTLVNLVEVLDAVREAGEAPDA